MFLYWWNFFHQSSGLVGAGTFSRARREVMRDEGHQDRAFGPFDVTRQGELRGRGPISVQLLGGRPRHYAVSGWSAGAGDRRFERPGRVGGPEGFQAGCARSFEGKRRGAREAEALGLRG